MARHPSRFRKGDADQHRNERTGTKRPAGNAKDCEGLCANCANRHTCLLPRSEGGVWHCEEFVEDDLTTNGRNEP
jgi:hypothetical protein